jgi:hypothetical protein
MTGGAFPLHHRVLCTIAGTRLRPPFSSKARFSSKENPMIDSQLLLAFVLAATLLMLIPGPNVGLIVANSVAYGPRYGLLTVAGTSSAMVVQLCPDRNRPTVAARL